ncbi:MAG: ROK family protein [Terracidiphilus sp.]
MNGVSAPRPPLILAFDVGGSHLSAGLCNTNALQLASFASTPLSGDCSFEAFVDLLYHLGCQVAGQLDNVAGAALAFPGPFDFTAGVSRMRHKFKSLYGLDLRSALAKRFGWAPGQFRFLNDAGAFLLGEVGAGAARGASRAVGIVLGTGIGSAFVRNGRWVTNGEYVPPGGEIWNLPYGAGIVEDLLSTRALKREYARRTGKNADVVTIAGAAATEQEARIVFEAFGTNLGKVIHDVLVPFSPEIVVVGGGISRSAHLFLPFAQDQLNSYGFRLVTSSLLDEAPLVGAAVYWRDGNDTNLEMTLHEPDRSNSLKDAT